MKPITINTENIQAIFQDLQRRAPKSDPRMMLVPYRLNRDLYRGKGRPRNTDYTPFGMTFKSTL